MSIRFTRLSDAKRQDQSGYRSGATASDSDNRQSRTNVSRLLSITAIIVALTVAGSLAIENVMRRLASMPEMTPVLIAEKPNPSAIETPVRTDETRMKFMERRLTLLERQIIMLQTQSTAEQQKQASIESKVSALEARLDADKQAAEQKAQAMSQAPAKKAVPTPQTPVGDWISESDFEQQQLTHMQAPRPASTPKQQIMPVAPEPLARAPQHQPADDIMTGSIRPAEHSAPMARPDTDLTKLVKPEVRNANSLEVVQTRFALSLNLHENTDNVRDAWEHLSAKHGDLLDRLEPRALPQGTQDGILMYRLIVGPVSNAAEAASRCAKLRTRGIRCTASVFSGEHLTTPPSPGTLIKVEVVASNDAAPLRVSANLRALIANPPIPRAKPTR